MARLSEIRNDNASLLLEGRFIDNERFTCDNKEVSAHAFVTGDRLAVVLWNPTNASQRATVAAPHYTLQKATWQDPNISAVDYTLMPNDVAVLVFRKGK